MNTNPKTHKKIITELAALESELDTVLFDAGDQAMGATAATVGIGGAAAGAYAYGRRGLKRPMAWNARDIGQTIGRGVSTAATDIKANGASLWDNLLKWGSKTAKGVAREI